MNAISKNGFTERILRIIGTNPKKSQRSNWLLLFLPLLLLLVFILPTAFQQPKATEAELVLAMPQSGGRLLAAPVISPAVIAEQTMPEVTVWPDSSKQPVVAMGIDKMNVLYIGLDNPITVAVPGLWGTPPS